MGKLMNWDWDFVYLVDDDVYVFLDHLQLKLCNDFSDGRPRVVGLPGCHTKCGGGMCGGGGVGFSRADLARFLGTGSRDEFITEFTNRCQQCEGWDDVTVGVFAKSRGMELGRMPGSEPWKMDLESQVDKVVSIHEIPTIWHYVREDMSQVHKLHVHAGEAMTVRHYIKSTLEQEDLPQITDHTRKVRKAMGLEDKTKFRGKKMKLKVFWEHSSCTTEHFTVGRFHRPEQCAPYVMASAKCGKHFMLSIGQFEWGCRCCDSVEKMGFNPAWKVYELMEEG